MSVYVSRSIAVHTNSHKEHHHDEIDAARNRVSGSIASVYLHHHGRLCGSIITATNKKCLS